MKIATNFIQFRAFRWAGQYRQRENSEDERGSNGWRNEIATSAVRSFLTPPGGNENWEGLVIRGVSKRV